MRPKKQIILFSALALLLLLPGTLTAADQFTITPVYHQSFYRNGDADEWRFHAPGLNVSFVRDGRLDLLFSFTASTPVWLTENGETHISYEYYSYPAGFDFLAGPFWSFPLGEKLVFEPSLGLHAGFLSLKGSGYQTVQFAPLGFGTDLRLKVLVSDRLVLGMMIGAGWDIVDMLHFKAHDTGYSLTAGLSAGFSYETGRQERKAGGRS